MARLQPEKKVGFTSKGNVRPEAMWDPCHPIRHSFGSNFESPQLGIHNHKTS